MEFFFDGKRKEHLTKYNLYNIEMGDNKQTPRPGMDNVKKEKVRNILCFMSFGILSLIFDEMNLIAAQDYLAGSKIATSNVIVAIALPVLVVKLLAPWCIQKCSFLTKSVLIVLLFIVGLVVLVTVNVVYGRLIGVSIAESGVSLGEITFLSLTAFYGPVTVSAFVAGIGLASLLAPLYYTSKWTKTKHFITHIHILAQTHTYTHARANIHTDRRTDAQT